MLVEIYNKTKSNINLALVDSVTKAFLTYYKKTKFAVTVIFIGDKEIQALNKAYRHKDKVTDVLSFTESDSDLAEENFLGEILIDYRQIVRQSKEFEHSVEEELVFILVHGLLHLLGYDDRTVAGAKEMEDLGNKFIKKLKL